ncbi:MAG: hypothetical protein P8123_04180 [bacterium]
MTNGTRDARNDKLIAEAETLSLATSYMSRALSEHASSLKKRKRFFSGLNFLAGFVIAMLAIGSTGANLLSGNGLVVLSIVAALLLLLDALLPSLAEEPNPERFNDYAWYIGRLQRDLKALSIDSKLPEQVWNARLHEKISLAQENMKDVEIKWPWITKCMMNLGWQPEN